MEDDRQTKSKSSLPPRVPNSNFALLPVENTSWCCARRRAAAGLTRPGDVVAAVTHPGQKDVLPLLLSFATHSRSHPWQGAGRGQGCGAGGCDPADPPHPLPVVHSELQRGRNRGGGVKGCWPELAAEDFAPRMSGRVCSRCCSRCGVVVEFYTYVFGIQTSLHLQPKHTYVVAYFRAHFAACIDDWLDERAVLSAGDAITSSTIPTCVWLNW